MNKKELAKVLVAQKLAGSIPEGESIINTITDAIEATVKGGKDVSLFGFGTFTAALQKGRSGVVPGTDKKYTTSDKMVPKFKPAKALKDAVAGN